MKNTSILLAPDLDKSFKLAVDASDIGSDAVLLQENDNCIDHPVCYFSKKVKHAPRVYISSSAVHPIIVFSDHNPLTFLDNCWTFDIFLSKN